MARWLSQEEREKILSERNVQTKAALPDAEPVIAALGVTNRMQAALLTLRLRYGLSAGWLSRNIV